jgi:O-6-methylguanine DNA methyltransferase
MENAISFSTKFGWITAAECNNKITSIQFKKGERRGCSSKILKKLKKNFVLYFKGETDKLTAQLCIQGNSLQKKIWSALKKIKKGNTITYGEIAKKFNVSPRYIGRVCGENRHILIVPCHRVIRSDGHLGGYSAKGGISLKKKLLDFENVKIK